MWFTHKLGERSIIFPNVFSTGGKHCFSGLCSPITLSVEMLMVVKKVAALAADQSIMLLWRQYTWPLGSSFIFTPVHISSSQCEDSHLHMWTGLYVNICYWSHIFTWFFKHLVELFQGCVINWKCMYIWGRYFPQGQIMVAEEAYFSSLFFA